MGMQVEFQNGPNFHPFNVNESDKFGLRKINVIGGATRLEMVAATILSGMEKTNDDNINIEIAVNLAAKLIECCHEKLADNTGNPNNNNRLNGFVDE